ncbi:MAG: aldo/keto reductase family protein [Myxococcota bacterium]|nr:aldo/keto reductase family protein [Myxococcota bacterium]
MQYRRVGDSGLEVSEIGFGSWLTLGSALDAAGSDELIQRAYDLGVNFFDTADVYANGSAEEALGRALRNLPRQNLVIASTCFFAMSQSPNDRGLSRKHVVESVEGSLRRLRLDYLDLHQCHRFDPEVPLEETVRAYEDLIRQGKILHWGVSQWTGAQIGEACRIADTTGAYRPISNQPGYSILRREIEAEVLPACNQLGIGQLAFSPLAQGALTGKYEGGAPPPGSRAADEQRNRFMGDLLKAEKLETVRALLPLADDLGISPAQLALRWCLRIPQLASVIVGATRLAQLEENCSASGVSLPDEVVTRIDEISPPAP